MPLNIDMDVKGCFVRWGQKGEKYYYICNNEKEFKKAKKKALAQAYAMGYFSLEEINLKTYTDYPESARNNAKRALAWAEKNGWGSCGTAVGKQRANQLASGEALSRDTIARMASFARHQQNKDVPYTEGCGGLMWDAWGGTAGIEWAQRKLDEIKMSDEFMDFEPVGLSDETKSKRTIVDKIKEEQFELQMIELFSREGSEMPNDIEIIHEEEFSFESEELLLEEENNLLEVKFANEKINGLFVYYKYDVLKDVGPKVIGGTRDFCKTMLKRNRVYTKDEIIKLGKNDYGMSILKYRGGFWNKGEGNILPTCRHTWKRILTRKKI